MGTPAHTQRHGRDLSAIRDTFPVDFSGKDAPKLIGPFLDQVVRMTFPLPGRYRVIVIPNPAAGAGFSQAVPPGRLWRLIAFSGLFTSDVNVASRQVQILFNEPAGTTYWATGCIFGQAASDVVRYSAGAGLPVLGPTMTTNDNLIIPLPQGIFLPEGHSFVGDVDGIQVGDTWTILRLAVEELPLAP